MAENKYFDITKTLPYQRNFIFINGPRSIGKTYSTLKWVIKRCKERDEEFIYVVRTQDEKKAHALEMGVQKVCMNEFPAIPFRFDTETMKIEVTTYSEESKPETRIMGYCIALSEAYKIKKRSFPKVRYMIFDEYMLEKKDESIYIGGWNEPDKFLNLYHTVDREQDIVIAFFLGNNTSFYNPYHLHPAFNIPMIKEGDMWMSENVLFWRALPSKELQDDRTNNKFLKMLNGSTYGNYAVQGEYIYDNINLVENIPATTRYIITIIWNGEKFGVFSNILSGLIFISSKIDPSCKLIMALTPEDVDVGVRLASRNDTYIKWIRDKYKEGLLRYDTQESKSKYQLAIQYIL